MLHPYVFLKSQKRSQSRETIVGRACSPRRSHHARNTKLQFMATGKAAVAVIVFLSVPSGIVIPRTVQVLHLKGFGADVPDFFDKDLLLA